MIPTLDRAALVRQALESLDRQRLPDWEALVVDDGSRDDTRRVVEERAAADGRCRYIRRRSPPAGASACRNVGIGEASGKYVVFLDSDDLLAPHCLQQRCAFLDRRPDLDFAVFPMVCFSGVPPESGVLWNVLLESERGSAADLARFLCDDPPWQTVMPIWRRRALERHRWDEDARCWQDWVFHVEAILAELTYEKVAAAPDCYLRCHSAPRMSSAAFTTEAFESRARSFGKIAGGLADSRHGSARVASLLSAQVMRQAELAAVCGRPRELVDRIATQALEGRADTAFSRALFRHYLTCQRYLAASGLPFVRGAFYRLARVLAPGTFRPLRCHHTTRRLSGEAIEALRRAESGGEPQLASLDWRRELTADLSGRSEGRGP